MKKRDNRKLAICVANNYIPTTVYAQLHYREGVNKKIEDIDILDSDAQIDFMSYAPIVGKQEYVREYIDTDEYTNVLSKYVPIISVCRSWRYNRKMLLKLVERPETENRKIYNELNSEIFLIKLALGTHFHAVMREVCNKYDRINPIPDSISRGMSLYTILMREYNYRYIWKPQRYKFRDIIETILANRWSNVFKSFGCTSYNVYLDIDPAGCYCLNIKFASSVLPADVVNCNLFINLWGYERMYNPIGYSYMLFNVKDTTIFSFGERSVMVDYTTIKKYNLDEFCKALLPELSPVVKTFSLDR